MGIDFYQIHILPYAAIIIKICRAYTNGQDDFEDYYQEVCLQIWRSKDNFKKQCEWSTWVYRISLNVCLTQLKQKKRHRNQVNSNDLPNELIDDSNTFANEDVNQLYCAIKSLSKIDRAIILLYLEEKSYREIADIIGSNTNNIGVRITRIKDKLYQHIQQQGEDHE